MTQTRVYLPATAADLDHLAAHRRLAQVPVTAYAVPSVTGRGRDLEELEYAAWQAAAAAAGDLVDPATTRRVVLSADVDMATVREGGYDDGQSRIDVTAPILLRHIASLHIDEEPGGGDADLLWYDVTELDAVIALLHT